MLILNIDYIPGQEIEVLGLVQGSVVWCKDILTDHVAGIRSIAGGEVTEYSEMLKEAREVALNRMIEQADSFCADAVINVRFGTSAVMQGAAELIAYGTAVKYK